MNIFFEVVPRNLFSISYCLWSKSFQRASVENQRNLHCAQRALVRAPHMTSSLILLAHFSEQLQRNKVSKSS